MPGLTIEISCLYFADDTNVWLIIWEKKDDVREEILVRLLIVARIGRAFDWRLNIEILRPRRLFDIYSWIIQATRIINWKVPVYSRMNGYQTIKQF